MPCSLLPVCCPETSKPSSRRLSQISLMRVIPLHASTTDHPDQEQDKGLHIALYLSQSYFFYEMDDPIQSNYVFLRKDEYDIDFEYVVSSRKMRDRRLIRSAGTQAHSLLKGTMISSGRLTRVSSPRVIGERSATVATGKHCSPRYSARGSMVRSTPLLRGL
jgi:hypothetical protein